MKKSECEPAIRSLCHDWAKAIGMHEPPIDQPSFSAFKSWLRENGYGHFLDFRSRMGSDDEVEMWFDQEFKQTWRN